MRKAKYAILLPNVTGRIKAKREVNYWCEEQFWCKGPELLVHCAVALCSEMN